MGKAALSIAIYFPFEYPSAKFILPFFHLVKECTGLMFSITIFPNCDSFLNRKTLLLREMDVNSSFPNKFFFRYYCMASSISSEKHEWVEIGQERMLLTKPTAYDDIEYLGKIL